MILNPAILMPLQILYWSLISYYCALYAINQKREFFCYFESSGQTKPVNEDDNTIKLQFTVPERQFIAKEYLVGSIKVPF